MSLTSYKNRKFDQYVNMKMVAVIHISHDFHIEYNVNNFLSNLASNHIAKSSRTVGCHNNALNDLVCLGLNFLW